MGPQPRTRGHKTHLDKPRIRLSGCDSFSVHDPAKYRPLQLNSVMLSCGKWTCACDAVFASCGVRVCDTSRASIDTQRTHTSTHARTHTRTHARTHARTCKGTPSIHIFSTRTSNPYRSRVSITMVSNQGIIRGIRLSEVILGEGCEDGGGVGVGGLVTMSTIHCGNGVMHSRE